MTAPPPASWAESRSRPERRPAGAGRRPSPPSSGFRFVRPARGWRAGAFALAAALALLLGAGAAQAQTSVKLVSNTGQADKSQHTNFGFDHAQAFSTGSDADGYKLTRVDFELQHVSGTQPTYSVSIHSDSSGSPGTSLGTLTNPSSLSSSWGLVQFKATGGGIDLAASTTYHVVVDVSSGSSNTGMRVTDSDAEDSGAATGWSIADGGHSRTNTSTGAWNSLSNSKQIAVHGYSKLPTFSGGTAANRLVTVNFTKSLKSGNCAALRAWTIKVDGASYGPTSLRCESRSVKLWLSDQTAPQFRLGQTITVSYDKSQADLTYGSGEGAQVMGRKLKSLAGGEVASFTDKAVTNQMVPAVRPTGATVNGKTLTLTFAEALNPGSVPSASAFTVSLPNCWLCGVAVTGVSVSGATATLTLDAPVPSHAEAHVEYKWSPGEKLLRTAAGVRTRLYFALQATVETRDTAPVFSSATISRPATYPWQEPIEEATLSIDFNEPMDESSVPPGSAFRVTARPRGGSARTIAGTGTVSVNGSSVTMKLARYVAAGETVTVSYVKPRANALRDRTGFLAESFSGEPATNGTPRIVSAAVSSDPGRDRTYGRGDTIRVQLRFNGPVRVTGTPRLRLSQGQGINWRVQPELPQGGAYYVWAEYESGSGTPALTFAYTVKARDRSNGIAVLLDQLELNGGRIRAFMPWSSWDADLSPPQRWLPYDANHKVDGSLPRFQSAAVDGKTLTLTFSADLDTASVPAPGAFRVTVGTARRSVARDGVAIDGATVRLTLASAVASTDAVKVRYTRPSSKPLQSVAGTAVQTFRDRAVTNNTHGGIWSATLTAKSVAGVGCSDRATDPTKRCSSALTENSFTWESTAYRVKLVTAIFAGGTVLLSLEFDNAASSGWTVHVDGRPFRVADATALSDDGKIAQWANSGLDWTLGQKVSLRLTAAGAGSEPVSVTGAAVDGKALTLTFTDSLDTGSVPAPGAFRVTVNGVRRNVTAGGVAIDGAAVALTLESAVLSTDTVKVRYTKPSASPLRSLAGRAVETFADQSVTNNTAAAGDTTAPAPKFAAVAGSGANVAIDFGEALHSALEVAENIPSRAAFTVNVAGTDRTPDTVFVAAQERTVGLVFLTDAVTAGQAVKVSYDPSAAGGDNKKLRDPAGNEVASFSEFAVTNVVGDTALPTFASAAVDGTALTVTLNELMNWRSSPAGNAFTASATPSGGTARTIAGTGTAAISGKTATVTLASAVANGDTVTVAYTKPTSGSVLKDAAGNELATFTGQSVTNNTAAGGPTGQGDAESASVTGVAVVSGAGPDQTYGDGDKIHVRVTFSGPVDVTGTPRIKIDMDPAHWGEKWAAYESGSGTSSLTFAHTVVEPNISTQGIAVLANTLELDGGTIRAGGADADLAHDGLAHDANHKVDWRTAGEGSGPDGTVGDSGPASVTGVAVVSSPASGSTYMLGETIRIRATFDQAVTVTGTPRLSIDMDPAHWGTKQAAYQSGSGTSSLTFAHTVVEPNYSTQGIAVLANTLTLNGGTIRAGGTNAALGHSGLGHASGHKVDWRPDISVADAQANEGAGAKVAFEVSLSRAFTSAEHRVTVDYATADGTAKAGEDYTATSGTLTFAAGEQTKTVNVPILDDAVDEGNETFVLRLSNVQGARAGDLEATGTIANDDPLQKMWLSRFGRTVADHVTGAVSDRLASPLSGAQVTVGGQSVDLAQTDDGAALTQALTAVARALGASEQPAPRDGFDTGPPVPASGPGGQAGAGDWPGTGLRDAPTPGGSTTRDLSGRELLLGSAFHLAREGDGGGPGLAAWGRVTVGGFDGEERADDGTLRIDGEVTTGILGADAEWNRLLAGVAVSVSEGEGTFAQPGVDSGTIESSMTAVSPYARLMVNDRVSVWGLAGFGNGDMTIMQAANENQPERVTRTDIEMRLAALGGRGALLQADETGGIDLGLRADAFYVETEAEPVSNEGSTTGVASRVRLALEGSRSFDMGGGVLTPGLELGLRHDGGDAETGTGVELGGRVTWTDPASGLSVEARARTLVAHEDSDYREWGASGSVRLDPGDRGRGLSFSLAPTYGAAASGVERIWSARDARGLAPGGGTFEPERRLVGELGYGLSLLGGRFTGTPNLGFGLSDTAREYRVGWRLTPAAQDHSGFEVGLHATRREAAGGNESPEHGVMLRGALRF